MALNDLPAAGQALEKYLLGWARQKVGEGLEVLKRERAFNEMGEAIKYVNGEQFPLKSKTLSRTTDNRIRKILQETASALTDVRPIWNYETFHEQFSPQAEILNKLARGWWKNSYADRKLQNILSYSGVGGSGYGVLTWNKDLPGGGDLELIPYDPRDVIPIEPVFSDSLQDWRGVILRQRLPVATVKNMFPLKAHQIAGTTSSWFGNVERESGGLAAIATSMFSILARGSNLDRGMNPTNVDLMRIFVKDDSINTGSEPVVMGDPGTSWAYPVYPVGYLLADGRRVTATEARLYPRGRLIICTPEAILRDIPNPYWHGFFPVIRFTLDPLPWSLLGASMVGDLIPLQNALNEGIRGLEDGMGQWVRRGVIADKAAISKENLRAIDTRKSGFQAHINPVAGTGIEVVDGPTFPNWYMEYLGYIKSEIDELSGVRALQQLAQLKQMPSSDTMEKYMDAMSPLLRLRARSIEVSLGELAEMLKVGFFQYYDTKRRMQILGQDGVTLDDFDYDPGTLVPAGEGQREERASKHHRNFTFSVAPNSFLNVSHTTQRMFMLQLLRANLLDPWTVWKAFDIADVGEAPNETIPERMVTARKLGLQPGPTPEMVAAQQALVLMQAQMALMSAGMGLPAPPGGGGNIPDAPSTSGSGPEGGRPPSGGQPPQFVQKGDRSVVSESGQ